MPAIRLLIKHGGDPYPVADAITDYKMNSFIDPEMALCSLNTIARKAETVSRGSISHACILASEAVRDRAIYRRAVKVYEMMKAGKSVEEAARSLDDERKAAVEARGSAILSGFTGHKIEMKFTVIKPQGRRTDAFTKKYWAFDSFVSYDISIDGKPYHIENLAAKAVPEFALNEKARENPDMGTALFAGAVLTQELQYIGHTIINVTVPAAVATLLGKDEKSAAKGAESGAYLTKAIPGAKDRAFDVARLAKKIYTRLNQPIEA
jgi:methylthioribose-1-phosphate isomerase